MWCPELILLAGVVAGGLSQVGEEGLSPMNDRPRLRELGVTPGVLPPGSLNAITDVAGVRVGHVTLIEGTDIRTGVTAVLPHGEDPFRLKTAAAVFTANGFGKAVGFEQVRELGVIESPLILTNTLSVGTALEATVAWTLARDGNAEVRSVNAVVGETNDGLLNDIRGFHVRREHVVQAIERARESPSRQPVEEGCIGAGTGTVSFGFKAGIGTSSRKLPHSLRGHTVGALVQANYGGVLTIDGVKVGQALGRYPYRDVLEPLAGRGRARRTSPGKAVSGDGSCVIVLATDAPLDARQLERLARRAVLGLARTGSFMSHGSGDFVIAFSTGNLVPHASEGSHRRVEVVLDEDLSPLFLAAVEATEEAVYNALTKATSMTGRGGRIVEAISIDNLRELFSRGP